MGHRLVTFSNVVLLISAIFFFTESTLVLPNSNDQLSNQSIKGIFQDYKSDLERPSKVISTLWVYNFLDGSTTELLKFNNVPGSTPEPQLKGNHLLYCVEQNCYLVTLPNKDPNLIATDVRGGMIFSQDHKKIVYMISEGVLKTYSITSGKTEILGNFTAYEEPANFIGYDSLNSKIIYLQSGALHQWRKVEGVEVLYQDKKATWNTASDWEINYRAISNDLTKVLITKENDQGHVSEAAIFDIPKRRYRLLEDSVAELLTWSHNLRFTADSQSIRGVTSEGYGASGYWNVDLDPSTIGVQTVFKSANGFIRSVSDDECRFLIEKREFQPNKLGSVSFFVEPLANPSKGLKVYGQKADGNSPGIRFVGWVTN